MGPLQVFGVFNGNDPANSRCVPASLDFTSATQLVMNTAEGIALDLLEYIQALYVDNGLNSADLTLVHGISQQRVTAKAHTQGYYPVLWAGDAAITITTTGAIIVPVFFLSFPVTPFVWNV